MAYNPKDPAVEMMRGYVNEAPPLEEIFLVKGKVALVTGGTSGLGFNVALRLLQGGAKVVLASFSETEGENALGLLAENACQGKALRPPHPHTGNVRQV